MKYKITVYACLLGLLGCSDFDPYYMFKLRLQHFPGQNFDQQLKDTSFFRDIDKKHKIDIFSKNNKTISYLITWQLDCTYIVDVNIKTKIIERAYIYNNTSACRTNGN